MLETKYTLKFEVVIGLSSDPTPDGIYLFTTEHMQTIWQKYAEEFFNKTSVYVSAIAVFGRAIYHHEWGCPIEGEQCLTFHCTANREFIEDLDMYEKGVLYIAKKLKKEFKQHTITITKIPSRIYYLTDEDNLEEE